MCNRTVPTHGRTTMDLSHREKEMKCNDATSCRTATAISAEHAKAVHAPPLAANCVQIPLPRASRQLPRLPGLHSLHSVLRQCGLPQQRARVSANRQECRLAIATPSACHPVCHRERAALSAATVQTEEAGTKVEVIGQMAAAAVQAEDTTQVASVEEGRMSSRTSPFSIF